LGSTFYRGCETCILVFDLTSRDSFNNLGDWKKEFLNSLNPPDADTYPFILFGNKSDLKDDIKVQDEEIEEFCKVNNNMPYFSTSAKDDSNLEEGFKKAAELAFNRYSKNEVTIVPPEIKLLKITKEEPKRCCLK